jgi:hypothetical protein
LLRDPFCGGKVKTLAACTLNHILEEQRSQGDATKRVSDSHESNRGAFSAIGHIAQGRKKSSHPIKHEGPTQLRRSAAQATPGALDAQGAEHMHQERLCP